jgi:phosphatidylinositol glycan class S
VKRLAIFLKREYIRYLDLVSSFNAKLGIKAEHSSRVVNYDSEYEITFSLVNEKPQVDIEAKIEHYIEKYFRRIIDQLEVYTNFSLKSQILLYSDFDSYRIPSKVDDHSQESNSKRVFYLKPADLSQMTNAIESRLGSRISDASSLQFVTYIPSKQPMYIIDETQTAGQKISSFLVPRWGAVYIHNSDSINSTDTVGSMPMKVFLTQFLELMGVHLHASSSPNGQRARIYSSEIYTYLLAKTLENQMNSLNTLKSLASLLTKISQMVIEENVAKEIIVCVEQVEKSMLLAKEGRIEQAFQASRQAFVSSEKAFFDASILEQLYFPEDQKFAVYIPLFIPIGIPVIMSLKTVINVIKKKRKVKYD